MVSEANRTSGAPSAWVDLRAAYSVAFGRPSPIAALRFRQLLVVWLVRLVVGVALAGILASLVTFNEPASSDFVLAVVVISPLMAVTFLRDATRYLAGRKRGRAPLPHDDGAAQGHIADPPEHRARQGGERLGRFIAACVPHMNNSVFVVGFFICWVLAVIVSLLLVEWGWLAAAGWLANVSIFLLFFLIWNIFLAEWGHKPPVGAAKRWTLRDYIDNELIPAHQALHRLSEPPLTGRTRLWGYLMLLGSFVVIPLLALAAAAVLLAATGNWSLTNLLLSWIGATLLLYLTTAWLLRLA